jgi:hypothetical protein
MGLIDKAIALADIALEGSKRVKRPEILGRLRIVHAETGFYPCDDTRKHPHASKHQVHVIQYCIANNITMEDFIRWPRALIDQ